MARIKGATMTHKRRKKMLKLAKGFYGCKSKHFKMAKHNIRHPVLHLQDGAFLLSPADSCGHHQPVLY